jgi:alkylation response protein AidB-like acyl-CoA dehydrogenase
MDSARAEQIRMICDSAAAIAPLGAGYARIRGLRFGERDFDRTIWSEMAAMGWLGLRLPEARGGAGLGLAEFCALAETLGAALIPEPFVAAAAILPLLPDATAAAALSGDQVILPAWQEQPGTLAPAITTSFNPGLLLGTKIFIPAARDADAFLVSTQSGLALVEANAKDVTLCNEPTQDGGTFGRLHFANVPAQAVPGTLATALQEMALGHAAYLLGLAAQAFMITMDYLRTRQQFGRPVGSFQALQHRAADLAVQIELARAAIAAAARTLDEEATLVPARQMAVSRAKARASDMAMLVTRQAIQLHGGIGFADESDIGLFLRKSMVVANQAGSAGFHRKRYAELLHVDAKEGSG